MNLTNMKSSTLCLGLPLMIWLVLGVMLAPSILHAQIIEVTLLERTPLDDESFHVEALLPRSEEQLILPDVDTTGAMFFEVFYSWDVVGNEVVSALVIPQQEGQVFYLDLNNDEDLSNDGAPLHFRSDQNELTFYIQAEPDTSRRVGRLLQRVPRFVLSGPAQDSLFRRVFVDEDGNLRPQQVMMWTQHNKGMSGKRGTYFFDDRIELQRGRVKLGESEYEIGLWDWNQNGLFNDVTNPRSARSFDRLLIDLDRDGKLLGHDETENFRLDDVFEVEGKRYRLAYVDPYGRTLQLEETQEEPTMYLLKALEAQKSEAGKKARSSGTLEDRFWSLTLTDLSGTELPMRDFKGQYIFLNFWGEWCGPCLEEIPALVAGREAFEEDRLRMISFLKTEDLDQAKEIIDEQGIEWPQVLMTEEIGHLFKIQGYPTNLLILPDGKTYLQAYGVSVAFFEKYIR